MKNKIAIITGASSGFGYEFVKLIPTYFPQIDEILVIARRKDLLEQLKRESNIPIKIIDGDLTNSDTINKINDWLSMNKPIVKLLINNAGCGYQGDFYLVPDENDEDVIKLNNLTLVKMTKIVLPYLNENSNIIQIGSASCFLPQPGNAVYAASKAFVYSFSLALREELLSKKQYVTLACPGPANTSFYDKASLFSKVPTYKIKNRTNYQLICKKIFKDSCKHKALSIYGWKMKGLMFIAKILPHKILIKLSRKMNKNDEKK